MDERMTSALATVRNAGRTAPFDENAYLEACTYLVEHRDALPYRVFVDLPGGLSGNDDPRWARFKELTESRCNCGNERTILPLNPRTEYARSEAPTVTVAKGASVYLKPVGGDKGSTYISLDILDTGNGPAFTFAADPFSGSLNFADLFSGPKGYILSQLADALRKQAEPAVMVAGKSRIPLFAIESADPVAGTIVIALDKDVEVFDPSTWKDPHA
ncbi:MAG TPA: hypothetical protein VL500_04980 [Candidatus Eisenbacteria bacterium]|jgi:hypothetical protein|nr:hypothetical protein [Candidatus Eisenbacteria bacterium]